MDFDTVLSFRRSIRRYTEEPLTEEEITAILEAAEQVPIGHADFKNYAICVITDREILKLLAEENDKLSHRGDPIYGAPCLFLILKTKDAMDTANLNAGIMAENMHLKATDLGLGSICVYSFLRTLKDQEGHGAYFRALHLPDTYTPIMSVAVGHTPIPRRERRVVRKIAVIRADGKSL